MTDRRVLGDGPDIIQEEWHDEAVVIGSDRRKDDDPASNDDPKGW